MPKLLGYGEPIPLTRRRRVRRRAIAAVAALACLVAAPASLRQIAEHRRQYQHRRRQERNDAAKKAVEAGDTERLRRLLDSGLPVDADTNGTTLLALAVERRNRPLIDLLLARGANANAGAYCPLTFAMRNDDAALAELLIARGASVDGRAGQDSLLHATINYGRFNFLRLLLNHGAKPDPAEPYGSRPLHLAAALRSREAVDLLLAAGADPDSADDGGRTPLFYAAWGNQKAIADALLAHGAKPTVWSAVAFGDLGAVKRYLTADPALVRATAAAPHEGEGLLFLAAGNGRRDVFEYLLSQGADLTAKGSSGYTLLHAASCGGDAAIVRRLLDAGLDVNAADRYGETPLFGSANAGHLEVARLLIDRGANLEAPGTRPRRWSRRRPTATRSWWICCSAKGRRSRRRRCIKRPIPRTCGRWPTWSAKGRT